MEGGTSVVSMDKGVIRQADSQTARGTEEDPARKVEFAAERLLISFGDDMIVTNIKGERDGKLISTANAVRTTVTGDNILMEFDRAAKESTLQHAVATGKGVAESRPLPHGGGEAPLPETKILRSDVIHLAMRPGGRDIEKIYTEGAGTIDFLPNRPAQPKRFMPSAIAPLLTMITSRPFLTRLASCSHQWPMASASSPRPSLVTRLDPTLTTIRLA